MVILLQFSALAAVVLTIDISNPSAVVFTTVGNNSQSAGDLFVNYNGGISLLGFFTANESIPSNLPVTLTGNWTALGTSAAFTEMVTFVYGDPAVVSGIDLSIYNVDANGDDDQNFLTTAAPFTGSAIADLSAFTNLPALGTTGNVNMGFMSSQGGVLGQWQIVPEPSVALAAAIGMMGFLRRRR